MAAVTRLRQTVSIDLGDGEKSVFLTLADSPTNLKVPDREECRAKQ